MSRTRIAAVVRKEIIQILRDPRSLLIVLTMPLMLMVLLGYGISLDAKHIRTCAFDRDGTQQSQDLLKRFQASQYFDLAAVVGSYRELIGNLDGGGCVLALVIPHDFAERVREGGRVGVQAIVDASDDNTANLIFGYSDAVLAGFSRDARLALLRRQGGGAEPAPLSLEARTWFNEELESRNFIVPGVIAIVMAVIGAFLTSLTISREWERGTMEQLISTPLTPRELMVGKLAPYFVIGMADVAECVLVGVWVMGVPFRGTLTALFSTSALFLIAMLCLGYLVSVMARSQLAASQMSLVATFLPAFLLSGFAFPLDQTPVAIRLVSYAVSSRYYVTILKAVFLKGAGLAALEPQLAALAAYALIAAVLATRAFHKRLA